MAVNQFADWTHDEFMAMQTLKVKDLPKTTEKYQMQTPAVASRVDWRDKVQFISLDPILKLKYKLYFYITKIKEQTKEP